MHLISEADACHWLGRRVSVISGEGEPAATGRMQHVSSRSVFLLQEDRTAEPVGGTIRLIPLARIERIVAAGGEEVAP